MVHNTYIMAKGPRLVNYFKIFKVEECSKYFNIYWKSVMIFNILTNDYGIGVKI